MMVAIVGVGALGSLLAARLAPIEKVILVGRWQAHLARLRETGLAVEELDGTTSHVAIHLTAAPEEIPPNQIGRVLVAVKGPQTAAKAAEIARFIAPGGRVLTLQNGLGGREILQSHLPQATVDAGSTSQGATMVGPGIVRHAGRGMTYLPTPAADWGALFTAAGLPVTLVPNVDSIIWGKLVINAGINPLTTLLDQPNGYLLQNPEMRQKMIAAAREAAAVAHAAGIELPYDDPAEAVCEVARQTAGNISSMLQDVRRGAPTEIESITGAILEHGRRLAIATPVNRWLYDQLTGG